MPLDIDGRRPVAAAGSGPASSNRRRPGPADPRGPAPAPRTTDPAPQRPTPDSTDWDGRTPAGCRPQSLQLRAAVPAFRTAHARRLAPRWAAVARTRPQQPERSPE